MRGQMMEMPLSIISLMKYAALNHRDTEIVSRTVEGAIHRYTYGDAYSRIQQLAHALETLGVCRGDRVATLAWNGYRHLELYYGVSGVGAVCHTVNPRLSIDQVRKILRHAKDSVIFADLTFVPLLELLAADLPDARQYVIMTNAEHMPPTSLPHVHCYESLLGNRTGEFDWPDLEESTASSLCYTSGSTGEPKGTLYSHRSTVLHAFAACFPDNFCLSSSESVLPVVPMFHVNAWGLPYAATMVGAKLVFPGPKMDASSLFELLENEEVTSTAGVPTIWSGLIDYLRKEGKRLSHLKRVTIGGSAVPLQMIAAFEEEFGVEVRQGWGMTEMSPEGTMGSLKGTQKNLSKEEKYQLKTSQGRPIYGVEMRLVDADGRELPRNGIARGFLQVRGPWVLSQYYENQAATDEAFDGSGWFTTGDLATIDFDGYMRIVDRTRDLIKSGGEWVSSIEIENAAIAHPEVSEAAAIALPHPHWGERPLLVVVTRPNASLDREGLMNFLKERIWKTALPDDVVFVAALPHGPTGKISKIELRKMFEDYALPTI
jgi:acyl-CoA synthetase (AMP-forming)/AMP-acid ligase II